MFEIELTPALISLLSGLLLCILYLLIGFRRYIVSVSGKARNDDNTPLPAEATLLPDVSVIVYAEDDAENMEALLPQLLEQDYPGRFEVIVVNDGSVPATKELIGRLEQRYSNLYMTFTPMESRALSRKKLALTIGIKAARYEVVIHTSGCCQVKSKDWLRAMCRHFAEGKQIVIGFASTFVPEGIADPYKRLHAFDAVRSAIKYLSWAIAGRPYRGTCHNLAYRRSVFFKNKGFSHSLNLKYGDDDIFISEVVTKDNTAVELSSASHVEVYDSFPDINHINQKLRYDYTARFVKTSASLIFASFSMAWWAMIGLTVALSLVGLPSLLPMIVSVSLFLITDVALMFAWRKTSKALGSRPILFTFPWFMTFEPVYNFYYRLKGLRHRNSNLI